METVKTALMSDTAREIVMVIMAFVLAGCTAMLGFTRGYEHGMNRGKSDELQQFICKLRIIRDTISSYNVKKQHPDTSTRFRLGVCTGLEYSEGLLNKFIKDEEQKKKELEY